MAALDEGRLRRLAERLLSPTVQVPEPTAAEEVPARLSAAAVEKVFTDNVPGVQKFLFRGHGGQSSLKYMVAAYQEGFRAFQGTPLQYHLTWLMRDIVHYGHEGGKGAARHLAEVAEAFMDCQAVQARAVERVGLRLRGVVPDFEGLVTQLVGEYKTLAVKMLAAQRLAQGLATDHDQNPTHYENRLTEDLGPVLGLNADDVRRAGLDHHAQKRHQRLRGDELEEAAEQCRKLFDVPALLQAFVAEVNSLGGGSQPESLGALFLKWADEHMRQKHVLLDEATCSRLQLEPALALCIFEQLYLGGQAAPEEETYGATPVSRLFRRPGEPAESEREDKGAEKEVAQDLREDEANPQEEAASSPASVELGRSRGSSLRAEDTAPPWRRGPFSLPGLFVWGGRAIWLRLTLVLCNNFVSKRWKRRGCDSGVPLIDG